MKKTQKQDIKFFCPFHKTRLTCLRGFLKLEGPEFASLRKLYHVEYSAMYGSDKCGCAWFIYIGPFKIKGKLTGDLIHIFQSWPFTCSQTREMFANPAGAKELHFREDVQPESNKRDVIAAPDSPTFCPFHHTRLTLMHPWANKVHKDLKRDFGVTHSTLYGSKECQCIWMGFYGNREKNYGSCHMFEHSPLQFDWFRELPDQPGCYEVIVPEEPPRTKGKKKEKK